MAADNANDPEDGATTRAANEPDGSGAPPLTYALAGLHRADLAGDLEGTGAGPPPPDASASPPVSPGPAVPPPLAPPPLAPPPTARPGRLSAGGRGRPAMAAAAAVATGAALTALLLWDGGADPLRISDRLRDMARDATRPPAGPGAPAAPSPNASPGATSTGTVNPGPPVRETPPTDQSSHAASSPPAVRTAQARAVLQTFIRGIGNGDPSVCDRYVTDAYATRTYGSMEMCRKDARNVTEWYRPHEVQAMRSTSVARGTAGGTGSVTVGFSDLTWTSGHMTAETVQERFLLRRVGGGWKIVG